ncbi:MAG TPA: ComEA family DNA-binding protein [bacterium]
MQASRGEQIVLLLGVAALVVGGAVLLGVRRSHPPVRIIDPPAAAEIVVQVDGAVVQPGLYRLPAGARVADALRAAGGPLPNADLESLNAARLIHDGERVQIPPRGAVSTAGAASTVNVNAATPAQLEALPGIGPVLARRILEYRSRHGPFRRLEDLLQVQGIGPALLRRLRGSVRFD